MSKSTINVCVGIDVGSVAVKLAACPVENNDGIFNQFHIQENEYFCLFTQGDNHFILSKNHQTKGASLEASTFLLNRFREIFPQLNIIDLCVTGVGGKTISSIYNITTENDFKAVAHGVTSLNPTVRTILELGGENARYMKVEVKENGQKSQIVVWILDYEKNGDCAAGTGAFFEQQATRLKYSVDQIGDIISQAEKSALIAGRCSVFAKTDMIHAQQKGYSPPAILRGLCEAVTRNFKSSVCKGKDISPPVALVGGMALNSGVVASIRQIFGLIDGSLVIPPFPASMGAIGCALITRNRNLNGDHKSIRIDLPDVSVDVPKRLGPQVIPRLAPLSTEQVVFLRNHITPKVSSGISDPIDVYLGIDIGSISTNLVILDDNEQILKEIYIKTDGRPIEVVDYGLREIDKQFGSRIRIRGIGTTGSGRELIGVLINADVVNDEITAHKTGALHISKRLHYETVDTIFEIGGQDSKYIRMENDTVVDFSMNEACAAGTGSFLEEQAERLGINIINEFSEMAFQSESPVQFGERCTVFIESDISTYIQRGIKKPDIVAGLAYSIALNYLNRVVRGRQIGKTIYFQGGTAYNNSVAAAFAMLLKKRIIVPPHNGVIGAIGMAILAREKVKKQSNDRQHPDLRFREFHLGASNYATHQFTCKTCSNYCEIQQVKIGEKKTYWGNKCSDKYQNRTKASRKAIIPDLIKYREQLLLKDYMFIRNAEIPSIGIPQTLTFYNRFPFFKTYFNVLGFQVVLSDPSNKNVIDAGIETTAAEPCFPIKLAYGHIINLLSKNVNYIFIPNIIDYDKSESELPEYACPWAMTLPFVIRCQKPFEQVRDKLIIPTIHFSRGKDNVKKELSRLVKTFGISVSQSNMAVECAYENQYEFQNNLRNKGDEARKILKEMNERAIVLVGRSYNIYDRTVSLNIADKLREYYGINIIPFDFLNLDQYNIQNINDNMFWYCGKQILQAALAVKNAGNLQLIFITNFKCGPDSYIKHYIGTASGIPFLTLQFDGHSNDAGIITRCEAFLHSKGFLN